MAGGGNARQKRDRRAIGQLDHPFKPLQTVHAGHVVIQQDHVKARIRHPPKIMLGGMGRADLNHRPQPLAGQKHHQCFADQVMIISQQDSHDSPFVGEYAPIL